MHPNTFSANRIRMPKIKTKPLEVTTIRLPGDTVQKMNARAKKLDMSRSELVRKAIDKFLRG